MLPIERRTSPKFKRNDSIDCRKVALTEGVVFRAKETLTLSVRLFGVDPIVEVLRRESSLVIPSVTPAHGPSRANMDATRRNTPVGLTDLVVDDGPHNSDGLLLHAWDGAESVSALISRRVMDD